MKHNSWNENVMCQLSPTTHDCLLITGILKSEKKKHHCESPPPSKKNNNIRCWTGDKPEPHVPE